MSIVIFVQVSKKDCPHAAAFRGIRMEVRFSIKSIIWNLGPRGSPLAAHVPKALCISSFSREPSGETNDRNRGWAVNVRRFFGRPVHLMFILRTADGRHTGRLRSLEEISSEPQCFSTRALGCNRVLRIPMMLVAFEKRQQDG